MCLVRNLKEDPLCYADHDIECYKVLVIGYCSPYRRMLHNLGLAKKYWTPCQYEPMVLGEEVEAKPAYTKEELEGINLGVTSIGAGFIHSYKNLKDALDWVDNWNHYVAVKCIIPKGTPYFTGKVNDGTEAGYASTRLKFCKIVKRVSTIF